MNTLCYLPQTIVPPQNLSIETLTSSVEVLGDGAFRKCLGLEGGALMNGINDSGELPPPSFPVRAQ